MCAFYTHTDDIEKIDKMEKRNYLDLNNSSSHQLYEIVASTFVPSLYQQCLFFIKSDSWQNSLPAVKNNKKRIIKWNIGKNNLELSSVETFLPERLKTVSFFFQELNSCYLKNDFEILQNTWILDLEWISLILRSLSPLLECWNLNQEDSNMDKICKSEK